MKPGISIFRDSYFMKMVLTVFLGICIPILCFGFFIMNNSYREMKANNNKHFLSGTADSIGSFEDNLKILQNHALNIAFERKISRAVVESNNFYAKRSTETLKTYKTGVEFADVLGLHYDDAGYVLTSEGYMYNLEYYADIYSYGDQALRDRILDFFTGPHQQRVALLSTFDALPAQKGVLFVAVPVSMSGGSEFDALLYYILYSDSMNGFVSRSNGFYIFDEAGRLLFSNAFLEELPGESGFPEFIGDGDASVYEFKAGGNSYSAFRQSNWNGTMTFMTIVMQQDVEKSLEGFYEVLSTVFLAAIVAMLGATVYINYKPIWRLICRINESEGSRNIDLRDGIRYIEQNYSRVSSERRSIMAQLTEQRTVLACYVLSDMLSGKAVSREEMDFLTPDCRNKTVFVLTALGIKLGNKQREELEAEVCRETGGHVYIIDVPRERHLAFVCLTDRDMSQQDFIEVLRRLLTSSLGDAVRLGVGKPADSLSGLRHCYLSSLCDLEDATAGGLKAVDDGSRLCEQINTQVMDFILQVHEGEQDEALQKLHGLIVHIGEIYLQPMIKKYILFDVFSKYANILKDMNISLDKQEALDILNYTSEQQYEEQMAASIRRACQQIACQSRKQKKELHRRILEYVDANYARGDLTLTSVADYFNMSIYMLSRVFKEISGIGFKEYVTARRLEESKKLLMTTDKSIKAIADEMEFYNADYFTRLFKKNYGVSPTSFRTLIHKQNANIQ